MQRMARSLFVGALAVGVAVPALAQTEIEIGIMDTDRQGLGGRFAQREGGVGEGDQLWSIDNPVTPLNADTNVLSGSPVLHRGDHTSTFLRGADAGLIAAFIRFDLLSQGKEVNDTITNAVFRLGSLIDPAAGSGQVNVYGLLPGHPNERWVETNGMSDLFGEWVESPPWPLSWTNAPAVDRESVGLLIDAETFGNGALLGSFTFQQGDEVGTIYSISGGGDSNLVNFLNAARTEGDHLATFIVIPADPDTPLLRPRARDAGGNVASKSAITLTLGDAALLPGDANRDGRVDGEDFLIWQAAFGTQEGATWDDGDFNGDGRVDGEDFLIWQAHFGQVADSSAVTPEPAMMSLLVLAGAGLIARRRRA